jgi:hypothetical protein
MTKIGDEVFRPIIRALDDAPVHLRPLRDVVDGMKAKQIRNRDGVSGIDKYDSTVTARGRNEKTTRWDPETGRPVSERGQINEDFGSSDRGDNATDVGNLGNRDDDGGHLGAHRFFGDTPDEGIVPQASNLNRGAWKKMENEWADWVSKGYRVDYDIDILPPGAIRPDKFEVAYTVSNPVTGDVIRDHSTSFNNVAGQTFNRVPSSAMPSL